MMGIESREPYVEKIWETPETMLVKTEALGAMIAEWSLEHCVSIDRIAVIPRGGLFVVNILSRELGLSGDEVVSLGISRYDRDHPTKAGDFKIGQLPRREDVEGYNMLIADEVHDTGETAQKAKSILKGLGAALVLTAAVHYKPDMSTVDEEPDFYVEQTGGWINYPWEAADRRGSMYRELMARR